MPFAAQESFAEWEVFRKNAGESRHVYLEVFVACLASRHVDLPHRQQSLSRSITTLDQLTLILNSERVGHDVRKLRV